MIFIFAMEDIHSKDKKGGGGYGQVGGRGRRGVLVVEPVPLPPHVNTLINRRDPYVLPPRPPLLFPPVSPAYMAHLADGSLTEGRGKKDGFGVECEAKKELMACKTRGRPHRRNRKSKTKNNPKTNNEEGKGNIKSKNRGITAGGGFGPPSRSPHNNSVCLSLSLPPPARPSTRPPVGEQCSDFAFPPRPG